MVVKRRCFARTRRAAGYTQEGLAEYLGVDRTTVARWEAGEYEPLDDKLAYIASQIWEKEQEILRTKDSDTKKALRGFIKSLEHDKSELRAKSKKLIDLSHKIIIFLDTPPPGLLNALIPLLSHDEYETEYDYVDTHNGIVTKTNVLRGWPVFIFAQATDLGHYRRYPEIQRKSIFTNPRMDTTKYEAIDIIVDSFPSMSFTFLIK